MGFLALVSILWALSFGLTAQVAGLGASFVAAARILLAALVFLPLLDVKGLSLRMCLALAGVGALQFGLMYVLYIAAFRWLRPSEVALATLLTPLWVAGVGAWLERRFRWSFLAAALLAVLGSGISLGNGLGRPGLPGGFLLMQAANLCFALGQVLYRRLAPGTGKRDRDLMGLLYLGAATVALGALAPAISRDGLTPPTAAQAGVLLYLGLVASGLGFFLFNAGARRVDLGTLAVFNNLKVPLAILASGLVFREAVDWLRLAVGGLVIGAGLAWNHAAARRP